MRDRGLSEILEAHERFVGCLADLVDSLLARGNENVLGENFTWSIGVSSGSSGVGLSIRRSLISPSPSESVFVNGWRQQCASFFALWKRPLLPTSTNPATGDTPRVSRTDLRDEALSFPLRLQP
jgi:hypothetical protein